MRALRRAVALVALLLGMAALAAPAAGAGDHVLRLRMIGVIDQINAAYIEGGLQAAADSGAAAVLIEIDSPGGDLNSLDQILKAILASSVPVITWVTPEGAQAASAAAFVTLAGDVAAMAPSTSIGAASVVGSGGAELPETIAKKITNSAVAKITELARAHNRNVEWAESAVRDAASASASEAIEMEPPIVDLLAANTAELFAAIDRGAREDGFEFTFNDQPLPTLTGLEIRDATMNFGQQFLHVLSDPNVAFILFTIGFYGIISELFHPNFFSGIVGAIAIVVAFIGSNALPLNVGGLLLILIGVGLLALEMVVASYGLLTVGGVIALVLGAFALWTGVEPGVESIEVSVSPWLIAIVAAVGVVYVWVLVRAMMQMRRQRGGVSNVPVGALVGASGTAQTIIGPTGIAYAGGESWSARTRGAEIGAGTPVRVVAVDGLELIVEPTPAGGSQRTEGEIP